MKVTVRVPVAGERDLDELLDELAAAPRGAPYADETLEVCGRFATRLLADPIARTHPELTTLGFFMRPAALRRLRGEFEAAARDDVVRVPHGLVFHVPPSNVDTIFMYSWLYAVVAGNANVVRLSQRGSPVVDHLCGLLAEVVAGTSLAPRVAMIQYGHDPEITAAISARAALRVVWGGDASVAAIRRAPLPPYARELTFADRWSLLALGAETIAGLDAAALTAVALGIYNDVFWFDQLGCSSPRLALWIGGDAAVAAASAALWPAVARVVHERGLRPDPAAHLARELFIHRAVLDGPVVSRADHGPALAVLRVAGLDGLTRDHPGAGLLFEAVAPSLDVLDGWVTRRDQTLTHAGLPAADLRRLAERLAGRGLDRIVPVGQALQMARFWDGADLAAEFVRNVHVVAG